jgi:hypothetical protein
MFSSTPILIKNVIADRRKSWMIIPAIQWRRILRDSDLQSLELFVTAIGNLNTESSIFRPQLVMRVG